MRNTLPLQPLIDIPHLTETASHAQNVVQGIRTMMLAPDSRKTPPSYNAAQLGEMCGVDKAKLNYAIKKYGLPAGTLDGNRLMWTLAEARKCIRHFRAENLRPTDIASAVTVTVANFKGGVAKTTTTAALAQGLSLRGHKVLVIDTDPQGSLSTLFGVLPDTDVEEEQTILPLCIGDESSLMSAIRPTYWDGIDLIAAAPFLFNAEFILPARQTRVPGFQFWRVLDNGLDEVREHYDVILIDTPPSLSYLTINSLIASDGVLMPVPPNALDFASSAQFWSLFTDVCTGLLSSAGDSKKFFFVDVLLSRVDRADAVSDGVRQWIGSAYGGKVLPIEIPKTSIAATASAEFGTVYDMNPSSAQAKTLKRAHDAYDQLVEQVERKLQGVWAYEEASAAA